MHSNKTAFVTGSSRGIGKAAAMALAEAGFDIIISARTVKAGDSHHSIPVPGSLEETAAEIKALGREVLLVPMDLTSFDSINNAWNQVIEQWGRVDVLVNNAVYQGGGTTDLVEDLTQDNAETLFRGNVISPLILTQNAVAHMRENGRGGRIINMVSESATKTPVLPVNNGGWSFAYAASKAAIERLVPMLKVELKEDNIKVFNCEPGFIFTEFMKEKGMDESYARQYGGAPVTVPAKVIAWLATSDEAAEEFHGTLCSAQRTALKKQLHPDWRPEKKKKPETAAV
ncbi:hypothetical protein EOPP23_12565 [Endozoicomonas sp. OPT23]|uniref:SDR family NAD(P)-dependent oxidoreductase n=1 Tax=Endozoicomonas sp. OPT23 TaxID=2072845 RepID=UPI00129B6310|nr:SDR family NAD(P)-dependent oxidoreductase [Endozoicomonas sp. OPT23]MRI33819.1 hypothetical protein [Endozoicomonas sp. OPT23]